MRLPDFYQYLSSEGIEVDERSIPGVTALSLPQGWILINRASIHSTEQELECLAHEAGHIMTGCFYSCGASLVERLRMEARANRWAYATLIPPSYMEQALHSAYVEEWELAEQFGVTHQFFHRAAECYKSVYGEG